MKSYSDGLGIEFLSSVFSIQDRVDIRFRNNIRENPFRVLNPTLLTYCDSHFDRVYLSTGTSSVDEIEEHLDYLPTSDVVLLHCVSSYPLEPKNTNLPRIVMLRDLIDKVGYSDHTFGI